MDNLSTQAQTALDALTGLQEASITDLREITGKAASTTEKALRELVAAGLATEIPANPSDPADAPTRWRRTTPPTDTDPTTPEDTSPEADTDAAEDDGDTTTDVDPGAGAAPARKPVDRKVLIIAGVLGDYPDGATIDVIADACGLGVLTVARYLAAMRAVDAARHLPADHTTGTSELWAPGPGRAAEVDPNPAPERCGSCGQVIRHRVTSPDRTRDASQLLNGDGSEPLGRNVLRGMVLDFLTAHPGHTFTPQDIATELSTRHQRVISNGAVRNNCTTLAAAGQIQLATETPLAFTANPDHQAGS